MNLLKTRILKAINKGLNEALDLDDFDLDDLKIAKKSLSTVIQNSNKANAITTMELYVQNLDFLNYINLIDLHKSLNIQYTVEDRNELVSIMQKVFTIVYNKHIYNVNINTINLNWIDVSNIKDFYNLFKTVEGYVSKFNEFTVDVSDWNMSLANSISYMFNLYNVVGLDSWDVSNIINFESFTTNMNKLLRNNDISNWKLNPNAYGLYSYKNNISIADRFPKLIPVLIRDILSDTDFNNCYNKKLFEQLDKMQKIENGTRKITTVGRMSNGKLFANYLISKRNNLNYAKSVMENEGKNRGYLFN